MSIEQENRTVCKCPPTAGFITFDDDTSYDSYVAVEKEVSNTRQAVILAVFIFSKFHFCPQSSSEIIQILGLPGVVDW